MNQQIANPSPVKYEYVSKKTVIKLFEEFIRLRNYGDKSRKEIRRWLKKELDNIKEA